MVKPLYTTMTDTVEVLVATVNAGEWQLVYVDGELEKYAERVNPEDIQDVTEDVLIESIQEDYRIGDVDPYDAPETYEELCEVTKD